MNVLVCASHIKALHEQMDFARSLMTLAPRPYTDSLTTPTPIKAIHFTELQSRTQ